MTGIQAAYYSLVRNSHHETGWRSYPDTLINVADLYYLPQKQAISTPGIAADETRYSFVFEKIFVKPAPLFTFWNVIYCVSIGSVLPFFLTLVHICSRTKVT